MNEKLLATIVIIISSVPALGIGIACLTRRWMPEQFSKLSNGTQMQFILGLGMLTIAIGLLAFGALILLLPDESLKMMTPYFVVIVNIVALTMVFFLLRKSKKRT